MSTPGHIYISDPSATIHVSTSIMDSLVYHGSYMANKLVSEIEKRKPETVS